MILVRGRAATNTPELALAPTQPPIATVSSLIADAAIAHGFVSTLVFPFAPSALITTV